MAEYHSISDLVKLSINNKQELWQVVLTGQAHDKLMSERDVFAQMKKMYQAMKSADEQYDPVSYTHLTLPTIRLV